MVTSPIRKLLDKFMKDMGWLGMFFVVAGFTIAWFGIIQPIALEVIEYRKFANRAVAQEEKSVNPSRVNAPKKKNNFPPVYYTTPSAVAFAPVVTVCADGCEEDESETAQNTVISIQSDSPKRIPPDNNINNEDQDTEFLLESCVFLDNGISKIKCLLTATEKIAIEAINEAYTLEDIEYIEQSVLYTYKGNRATTPSLGLSENIKTLLSSKKLSLVSQAIESGSIVTVEKAKELKHAISNRAILQEINILIKQLKKERDVDILEKVRSGMVVTADEASELYYMTTNGSEAETIAKDLVNTLVIQEISSGYVISIQRAEDLYFIATMGSEAKEQARELLKQLKKVRAADILEKVRSKLVTTIEEVIELYKMASYESEARRALRELADPLVIREISLGKATSLERAEDLYRVTSNGSEAEKQARELLEQFKVDSEF